MTIPIYWRLPMTGDMPSWRNRPKNRGDWTPPVPGSITEYLDYLLDTARAAETAGFAGGLLPSFPQTDDPWVVASALARETRTFRFMVAFQPGFLDPVYTARLSATLQRLSGGRLLYNVITGGGGPDQLWWGDPVAHDDRYARTAEFLDVLRGVWNDPSFHHRGRFYTADGSGLGERLRGAEFPEVYFSGSSDAAIDAAAQHADYYLSWLEHPDDLRAKFARVRERAAAHGRVAKFAVRAHVIARPTEDEAWEEVAAGWRRVTPEAIAALRNRTAESVGAKRLASYQPETPQGWRELIVAPNYWAGIALLGDYPTIGIVGSYEQAAARISELLALGVDALILAGLPHLEEAYRVGEHVLPRLSLPTPVRTA